MSEKIEQNEIKVKISGSACANNHFGLSKNYDLTISEVEVKSKEVFDNEDGTNDTVYKIKLTPYSIVNAINEKEFITGKPKKGSQSQKQRMAYLELYNQQYSGQCDFEEFYNKETNKVIEDIEARLY
ncbi:MAG: hypothetical protein KJ725_20320 [Gammaproteobacteria bacterium]|nr:hypothetical protein [Gammaproteobacteria bacterium]